MCGLGKLYFYSNRFEPELESEVYTMLNIDSTIVYQGYNKDFGPLNLAGVHRYITQIQSRLEEHKAVVHHTSTNY